MAEIFFVAAVHGIRDVLPAVLGAVFAHESFRAPAPSSPPPRDDSTPLRRPNLEMSSVLEMASAETVSHGAIGQG
jgi:hypothetical protein